MNFDAKYKKIADCVSTDIECFSQFFHAMFTGSAADRDIEAVLAGYLCGNADDPAAGGAEICSEPCKCSGEWGNCVDEHCGSNESCGANPNTSSKAEVGRHTSDNCKKTNLKGKLIRPVLIFLFTRAAGIVPAKPHYRLAFCDEMLHNASLIHDDIIDDAKTRRNVSTLNSRFDSRFAVIAGDYLLAKAIEALSDLKNSEIIKIHADCIRMLISGETKQYFSRYDALSLSDYIKKSENKTAALFQAALKSVSVLNKTPDLSEFAKNFGIAFQIHNDLKNFEQTRELSDDIKNGIYTAPVLFYLEKFNNIDDLPNCADRAVFVEKTKLLIKEFTDRAIENISTIGDNQYKEAIINLCNLYSGT